MERDDDFMTEWGAVRYSGKKSQVRNNIKEKVRGDVGAGTEKTDVPA